MKSERWARVQELFDGAADLAPAAQEAYLAAACDGDGELRREVESLLRSDAGAGTFLEQAIRRGSDLLLAAEPEALETLGKVGKYEILGRIGEGGFGVVYQGRDAVLQRFVAVKTCSSSDRGLRRRFFREGQIAAGLQHPNITTVHDLGVEGGIPYLVQEFLGGEDLHRKIARREPLTPQQRLDILAQVSRGLEYAHLQGVLHRDIKPANIRVLPGGAVKIMDFGIAKLLHEVSDVTTQGVTLGTVGYLAPEQLRGEAVDRRTDVFAFGVLAYELLTGERPFKGRTFSEVSYRLLNEEPRELHDLAPFHDAIGDLVKWCLVKDVEQRCPGFAEVLAVLEPEIEALRSGSFAVPGSLPERPAGAAALPAPAPMGADAPAASAQASSTAPPPTSPTSALPFPPAPTPPKRPRAGGQGRGGRWAAAAAVALIAATTLLGWQLRRHENPPAVAPGGTPPLHRPRPDPPAGGGGLQSPGAAATPVQRPEPPPGKLAGHRRGAAGDEVPNNEQAVGSRHSSAATRPAAALAVPPQATGNARARRGGDDGALPFERAPSGPLGAQSAAAGGSGDGGAGSPPGAVAPAAGAAEGARHPLAAGAVAEPDRAEPEAAGAGASETAGGAPRPMVRGDLIAPGSAGAVPPRLLSRPAPLYPDRARRRKAEADVLMLVLVDEGGRVLRAIVKRTDDDKLGFNEAARQAALRATFAPATRDGLPGKMWTELPFSFRYQG
jgi:eukaryotic-like serine/threonine-protein kinase